MSAEVATVEQLVRAKLADALGGRRGMVESAAPIVAFTACWVATRDLRLTLTVALTIAAVLLVLRLVQRGSVQFVLNAGVGIAIAAVFAARSGEARDAFLPGIYVNAGYASAAMLSIVVGWPLVGFMFGAATGDPTRWHGDRGVVRLCTRLTWVFLVPFVLRVVIEYPLWAADRVALLGVAKIVLGWPLVVAAFAVMAWMLGRDRTPLDQPQ